MDKRPWLERLLDRDNPAAPMILLVLLVLAIGTVCSVGPMLDRAIENKEPGSYFVSPRLPPI